MFFASKRLSVADLIELCRAMRFSLASGLMLREVMELLATRGTRRIRAVASEVVKELKAGWGLQEALNKHQESFPPLFLAMAAVGEESGNLPEVLGELEKYYTQQQKLRREFVSEITWPVFQVVFAVLVIAGLILVVELLGLKDTKGNPYDPLGLGLYGERGALLFLQFAAFLVLGVWILFLVLRRLLRRRAIVERFLFRIPLIGPCLRAIVLTRFCVALRFMLETNLPIMKAIRLSLQATDNAAFVTTAPAAEASLRKGNGVATSLTQCQLFPESFISAVVVGEESGRLPEILRHQGDEYDDAARRRLNLLNKVASWLVWLGIAFLMIFTILSIFKTAYMGNIEKVMGGGL
jgi:type IV pilus assembly protein PilC